MSLYYAGLNKFTPGPIWSRFSIPIWPKCNFSVSWPPPSHLDNKNLDGFVQRWRDVRRVG